MQIPVDDVTVNFIDLENLRRNKEATFLTFMWLKTLS